MQPFLAGVPFFFILSFLYAGHCYSHFLPQQARRVGTAIIFILHSRNDSSERLNNLSKVIQPVNDRSRNRSKRCFYCDALPLSPAASPRTCTLTSSLPVPVTVDEAQGPGTGLALGSAFI